MNTKVKVKVPKRSGFDKSHQNILTTKCGTLTPVLVDELIPNSHVDLAAAVSASLPPLASDTFMRCDLKMEAFFVPHRLIYGGFEKWLTGDKVYDPVETDDVDVALPSLVLYNTSGTPSAITSEFYGPGSLLDYLGGKVFSGETGQASVINPFPMLSYYRIYDDWYRNTQVQKPLFYPTVSVGAGECVLTLSNLPYVTFSKNNVSEIATTIGYSDFGSDNEIKLGQLMQRNFGMDYFTIATPKAQLGDAQKVTFATNAATGEFTIAALRAANSLQQFAERNALGGLRLQDYVKNNYGADLSTGVAQRAIYLGSCDFNVYSKGVYNQTNTDNPLTTNNPMMSVGTEFGSAKAVGESSLVKDFTANEPGTLMVLASLVPRVTYSTGFNRILGRYNTGSITDMANPMLQNVGNQPIFQYELAAKNYMSEANRSKVFGYTDRYADWKYMPDELHGLLRDGQSLESFALQRTVSGSPVISSEFLKIPTDYLDQVAAVNGDISRYGVWFDSYFKYHVSMPLSEYSIPSLQDPAYEHGIDVDIDVRGSRL